MVPAQSSGGRYQAVHTFAVMGRSVRKASRHLRGSPDTRRAMPKSANTRAGPKNSSWTSAAKKIKQFPGFTSRWMMPREWTWARADASCPISLRANAVGRKPRGLLSRKVARSTSAGGNARVGKSLGSFSPPGVEAQTSKSLMTCACATSRKAAASHKIRFLEVPPRLSAIFSATSTRVSG